jgi:hypothetical protein
MNGQWTVILPNEAGAPHTLITINIDDCGEYFQGTAFVIENTTPPLAVGVGFVTANKENTFQLHNKSVFVHDPQSGQRVRWDEIKSQYPEGFNIPASVDIDGEWTETSLQLSWQASNGQSGKLSLCKSEADRPSNLKAQQMSWSVFKQHVSQMAKRRHLFRGQAKPWRLRTKYHRSGRADLSRFLDIDVNELYRRLSSRTKHKFNRNDADENGAFLNLLQHHGYPTPLLDWTYSPYVAAFFAYRDVSRSEAREAEATDCVRIFILDERWRTKPHSTLISPPFPNFSILEFLTIDNDRMIPQQALSAITNVDDIESYITTVGKDTSYLSAIDLPITERETVYADLAHMGITAGSLFPGLDGACEELKERLFL